MRLQFSIIDAIARGERVRAVHVILRYMGEGGGYLAVTGEGSRAVALCAVPSKSILARWKVGHMVAVPCLVLSLVGNSFAIIADHAVALSCIVKSHAC